MNTAEKLQLQNIVDCYTVRSELYTSDAECAQTMRDKVQALLSSIESKEPAARLLRGTDAYCPQCGHNRDKSSVSSIVHPDGTRLCQLCNAMWKELSSTESKESVARQENQHGQPPSVIAPIDDVPAVAAPPTELPEDVADELVYCGRVLERYENPSLQPLSKQNFNTYDFARQKISRLRSLCQQQQERIKELEKWETGLRNRAVIAEALLEQEKIDTKYWKGLVERRDRKD